MRTAILFPILVASTATAFAADLAPGSKAPALSVKSWYKGSPIKQFAKDKIYVVEFWATWCGPCKTSIPHLTEMAKANKDVKFIGVSIWEDDKDGNIKKFVKEMGAKMDYTVGYSGNKTGMSKTWMEASGQNGIPTAFVIKNQKIQWIGHPMELEKPLAEVKSGKFNIAKFKEEFAQKAKAQQAQEANEKEFSAVDQLIRSGKFDLASQKLDTLAKDKTATERVDDYRFVLLSKTDPAAWEAKAREMATRGTAQDRDILCSFAFRQTNEPGGDLAKGKIAIEGALSSAKEEDIVVFYNAAMFYSKANQPKQAVDMMDKAIAGLPKSQMKDSKEIKEMLTKERDEMAKKIKS